MKIIIKIYLSMLLINCIAMSQIDGRINIGFEGPIDFIMIDSVGRKTGYNPMLDMDYNEIPNTEYGEGCCGSMDTNDIDEIRGFSFLEQITTTTFKENYTLQIFGREKGSFIGNGYMNQTVTEKGLIIKIIGVIDSSQSVTYKLTFTTDSTQNPTMHKVVSIAILRQDLENCYKLNLIHGQSLYADLMVKVNRIDTALIANDTVSARFYLLQFDIQIDSTANDTLQLSPDGYQILKEDVMQMFSELPPHVVPSTPVPQYNVILNVIGNGTVTKSPELALYDSSTTVTLTAKAGTGYRLSGWSGDASGTSNPISIVMDKNKKIRAVFVQVH